MVLHIIDVGFGNMVLALFPSGETFLIDCNVTEENKTNVLPYLQKAMGKRKEIDVFICTHRDSDHMRGIKKVHNLFPIKEMRDSGDVGTTPDCKEYLEYMKLRREIGFKKIEARKYAKYGDSIVRYMNSVWDDYDDPNQNSVVVKLEHEGNSLLIAGDTDYRPWKEKIIPFYENSKIKSSILVAAHHGSITFFDDPCDEENYYTRHIKKIKPDMTIISVGPNSHDLPDSKAIEFYEKYSKGSKKGNKLYTTQDEGNIKVTFTDEGWTINKNQ